MVTIVTTFLDSHRTHMGGEHAEGVAHDRPQRYRRLPAPRQDQVEVTIHAILLIMTLGEVDIICGDAALPCRPFYSLGGRKHGAASGVSMEDRRGECWWNITYSERWRREIELKLVSLLY